MSQRVVSKPAVSKPSAGNSDHTLKKIELEIELARRVAELREGFDRGFAEPPTILSEATISVLAIRLGAVGYAIRIEELAGVEPTPKLVALPGALPEMLGLAAIRGRLVPVYDLAALLQHREPGTKSWLAICGHNEPLGLTFDELDGYAQASRTDLYPSAEIEGSGGHVREVFRQDGMTRMVVSSTSIVAMLRARHRVSDKGT